jgi:hypothetical protein
MTENAILPDGRGAPLADDQWAKVLAALPDALSGGDPDAIRPKFVVLDCAETADLPATGMYVVLDGEVALLHKDDRLATARPGDYFYEEHLQLSGLPVSLTARAGAGARIAFLSVAGWFELPAETRTAFFGTLFGDLVAVQMQNFQQSINCCSVTAAALGMSALGFSCEVNDIFRRVNLASHYVVNTGISLGELFDIACTYIHNIGLRDTVQVQAYFMDEGVTSAAMLQDAVMESARIGGPNDILVANFQVGLAHGVPEMPGGHFAIIAKCNPSTGLVHMLDVHPEKYGKMWVTTVARLYAAMSDRDGGSMRARGLLRFSAREAVSTELATLVPARDPQPQRPERPGRELRDLRRSLGQRGQAAPQHRPVLHGLAEDGPLGEATGRDRAAVCREAPRAASAGRVPLLRRAPRDRRRERRGVVPQPAAQPERPRRAPPAGQHRPQRGARARGGRGPGQRLCRDRAAEGVLVHLHRLRR